jgi:cytochrome c553
MSRSLLHALLGAALALAALGAFAQAKPPAKKAPAVEEKRPATAAQQIGTENFHAQCIGCHGIPGYKTAFPEVYHVPKIAGQQPGYIIAALKAYKSGDRSHPSMRGIAASLNEEQMKQLAEFYGAPAK